MGKIAVLGAGISGLTSAFYLGLSGHEVTIFESQNQIGGLLKPSALNISQDNKNPIYIDLGAETFALRNTEQEKILNLLTDLNLQNKIRYPSQLGSFIYDKTARKIPKAGPFGVPTQITPQILDFLSLSNLPSNTQTLPFSPTPSALSAALTLSDFIVLHFGKHIGRKIIKHLTSPIVEGVYSMNPRDLLWRAAAPNLDKLFTKNTIQSPPNSPGNQIATLDGGMHTLIQKLAKECTKMGIKIKTNTKAKIDLSGNLHINGTEVAKKDFDFVFCTSIDAIHDWLSPIQTKNKLHIPSVTFIVYFKSSKLNTCPIGTGCLFVKNTFSAPPKGITHINAKWPHIQSLLPENTHILRISYKGVHISRKKLIHTIENLFNIDLKTQNLGIYKQVWHRPQLFWNKNQADLSAKVLQNLEQFPKVKAFGHYINGSGVARVVPFAVDAANSI